MERNTDTLPIWAPSQHGRRDKHEYRLEWISPNAKVTVQKSGEYGLLRWQDKLVLAVLVLLWSKQGRNPDGWVNFIVEDVVKALHENPGGKQRSQVKDSLWRLRGCLIQYYQSFFDSTQSSYVSRKQGVTILRYLTIYGYNSQEGEEIEATQAQLDLDVVRNLIGNYTRPISLDLWLELSERGGLFEAYISSVLYGHDRVSKDIFELWNQLGLSTKGVKYGSKLAYKMRPELDKICADPYGLLERYEFESSKTRPRSKNLVLFRRRPAYVDQHGAEEDSQLRLEFETVTQLVPNELDRRVEQVRFELGDKSPDDTNIRRIVERMPPEVITRAITDAVGRGKDGIIRKNPTAYFVGRMKKEAKARGIDLGFKPVDSAAPATPGSTTDPPDSSSKSNPPAQPKAKRKGRAQRRTEDKHEIKRKIDSYFINLPEAEQEGLRTAAAAKAQILLDPESAGFEALVHDNIRRMVAERLRVQWEA